MYEDHSLEKLRKVELLDVRRSQRLVTEYDRVNSSLSLHKMINQKVDYYSMQLSSYFHSVSELEITNFRQDLAAVQIQKMVRGYLTRINHQKEIIQIQKNLLNKLSSDLSQDANFCLFNVGRNADFASRVLQKAVRNFLFRKKLQKFEIYYEKVIFERDKVRISKLIAASFVVFSKFKITHMKYLKERDRRLRRIRRKLAVLRIKNVTKREGILIRNVRTSIKKYKRKLTLKVASVHSKATDEDASSHQSEIERLLRMKAMIEMEDARREKIKLGKISYKISKPFTLRLAPRLKPISNSSSNSSFSESPIPIVEKPQAFTVTPEPVIKLKTKKFNYRKGNYMFPTISFRAGVKGFEGLYDDKTQKPKTRYRSLRTTAYTPTQFSLQKVRKKINKEKIMKPSWCINPKVNECYTPSIFSNSLETAGNTETAENRFEKMFFRKKDRRLKIILN
ncbi:hypothetical protein SteCoe_8996 [Stentor coeruleus]|uniref:Uncharacterized protein n=1 Tax=Stentor coeruleus TaxID=5963 RepID=A0A1R2CIX2_9CILI|nr:hypothetical protein SteCoe_8996 [Stentor coeruleus]